MWIAAVALMDLTHFEDGSVSYFPMVTQLREKQDLHILLHDSETQGLSTYYLFCTQRVLNISALYDAVFYDVHDIPELMVFFLATQEPLNSLLLWYFHVHKYLNLVPDTQKVSYSYYALEGDFFVIYL